MVRPSVKMMNTATGPRAPRRPAASTTPQISIETMKP
jgi:hypothetical protein